MSATRARRARAAGRVVVTGATGGLGRAVVRRLLEAGADCHATYLDSAELDDFPERDAVQLACVDCTSEPQVEAFFAAVPGPLHASVHLVGGFSMAALGDTGLAQFERMFRLNAVTAFLCCREAARYMPEGGRIVNVAARPVLEPTGGMAAYTAAKGAVAALTQALARELAPHGILVNAVVPSIVDTPQNRRDMPEADFSRWPKPDEIAETVAFLAGPDNRLTSGALVPVYGRA